MVVTGTHEVEGDPLRYQEWLDEIGLKHDERDKALRSAIYQLAISLADSTGEAPLFAAREAEAAPSQNMGSLLLSEKEQRFIPAANAIMENLFNAMRPGA